MMALGLKLLLAHILGDFVFLPGQWAKDQRQKKHHVANLFWHMLVHALALCTVLWFNTAYWGAVVAIVASHFATDLAKRYLDGKINVRILFALDQFVHLSIIALVVYLYEPYALHLESIPGPKTLLLIVALLSVSAVSATLMRVIMSKWRLEDDENDASLKNAGMYIGVLERLLVFGFIVLNQWQAIGFLIAAKSVFRFSDLSRAKDRKLTEYILIGTLMSFGLAIVIGLCYLYLKNMFPK